MRYASLLFALLCSCASAMPRAETGFLDRAIRLPDGRTMPYVVYVPPEWKRDLRLPVVLFLHGSGERGDDGLRQTAIGIGSAIRWDRDRAPMLVVMPQAPAEARWLGGVAEGAMAALDQSIAEFGGDPSRVILTGMSMGGYGVYALAWEHPDRFAALVPVCGGILGHPTAATVITLPAIAGEADPYAKVAERLRGIPVWIFHGANDDVIPPEESRRMSEALRGAGATVRYTEFPDANHNAWDPAYGNEELWRWMGERRRR